MLKILLTNDDGIDAKGLCSLEESLRGVAEIIVVAPDRERSAVSHGLTLHAPLDLKEVEPNRFTLNGTPADCVIYALNRLVEQPALVISGINHGANIGEDVMYSGTVAAAREASRHAVPSIAVSQAYLNGKPISFDKGARFVRRLVENLLGHGAIRGLCLNVNLPVSRIRGVKVTRQACEIHSPHFNSLDRRAAQTGASRREDCPEQSGFPSDWEAIRANYVSITPLHRDQTDYAAAQSLARAASELFPNAADSGNWVDRLIKLG
jgi:5'-nucleotidase